MHSIYVQPSLDLESLFPPTWYNPLHIPLYHTCSSPSSPIHFNTNSDNSTCHCNLYNFFIITSSYEHPFSYHSSRGTVEHWVCNKCIYTIITFQFYVVYHMSLYHWFVC